jgi:cell wall-associated NlpC family hydrolase
MIRRHLLFNLSVIILIGLLICPLRTTLIRLGIISLTITTSAGLCIFSWSRLILRWLVLPMTAACILFTVWPARSVIDSEKLRSLYLAQLPRYQGVRYVYGGETRLGIDCSGLVRAAMFNALRIYAIKTINPVALRASIGLWWRDCNAIDLGRGRTGDTFTLGSGKFVALGDHEHIRPGDLAVTESGSHVLAYLGNDNWIEAEPTIGRTHIFQLTDQFASLAGEKVRFVRWRWLSPARRANEV